MDAFDKLLEQSNEMETSKSKGKKGKGKKGKLKKGLKKGDKSGSKTARVPNSSAQKRAKKQETEDDL